MSLEHLWAGWRNAYVTGAADGSPAEAKELDDRRKSGADDRISDSPYDDSSETGK